MRNYLFITLIFILLGGCASRLDISGKYGSTGDANVIQLEKDSTFIYEYRAHHFYEYSTGTWRKLNNKTIVLNSHFKSTRIPIACKESQNDRLLDINIIDVNLRIRNGLDLSDYISEVIINSSTYLVKRCDSLFSFPLNLKIKSIRFKFIKESVELLQIVL